MNIHNLKSCITHDEATIRSFIRDPEYADFYLQTVIADGDPDEIAETQAWYDEAKNRIKEARYWDSLAQNAEITVQRGYNIENALASINKALGILKAATTANV